MKQIVKTTALAITFAMLLLLCGCTGGTNTNGQAAETTEENNHTDNSSIAQQSPKENSDAKSLVVYFSWSGNTQQMAQLIADESVSEIYNVTPQEAYSTNYNECADRAKNELDNGVRPKLSNLMSAEEMAKYDTVYVGFPIWWYDLPMSMTAFLENYNLSDKTIIPFFSHNGSSSGAASLDTLTKICSGATVRTTDALSIYGSSVEESETQIREWVKNIK